MFQVSKCLFNVFVLYTDQLTHLRYKLLFAFGALAHTHVFAVQ